MKQVRCIAEKLIVRALPGGVDTNFRLRQDEVVTAVGQSFDGAWLYVYNHILAGWASAQYLSDEVAAPDAPDAPATPAKKLLYSLEGEDPELTHRIETLRMAALQEGIEFTTADFGGMRTEADTVKIMKYRDDDYAVYLKNLKPGAHPIPKEDWRRIAPFGSSYHNYGCARDLKPTKWPASLNESSALDRLRALAPTVKLQTISKDPPHFQLPITLQEARERWQSRQVK